MQNLLLDKRFSGFELHKLLESEEEKARATAGNCPRVWPTGKGRHGR